MGGSVQPQQHVQIFLNVVEFRMNAQQAVEIPRINHGGGRNVTVERMGQLSMVLFVP